MKIGLTGGIASGKSTVSKLLVHHGAAIIDADLIAREVVLPGSAVLQQVVEKFGQAVILEDGSLHRKALSAIIFGDEQARKDLEAILHPPIRAIIIDRMMRLELEDPYRLVVVDIPLLYESRLESLFTEIMVVYVPEHIQVDRLLLRDNISKEQALSRIQSQMSIEEKRERADVVIDNSGTIKETELQIEKFCKRKGLS